MLDECVVLTPFLYASSRTNYHLKLITNNELVLLAMMSWLLLAMNHPFYYIPSNIRKYFVKNNVGIPFFRFL